MRKIIEFFTKDKNNLEKNIEEYAKKEKIKEQRLIGEVNGVKIYATFYENDTN